MTSVFTRIWNACLGCYNSCKKCCARSNSGVAYQPPTINVHCNPVISPTFNNNGNLNYNSGATSSREPSEAANRSELQCLRPEGEAFSESPSSQSQSIVEWIPSNMEETYKLIDKAVVGGYDIDETDLWVIRSRFKGEVIPGKLNYHHNMAFAVHLRDGEYKERNVFDFEVCCADPDRIKWIKCSNGEVPRNAVPAGRRSNETLYVGRAAHNDEQHSGRKSLCPGFIQPSHGVLYVTYNYDFHAHKFYEVMCVE